MLSQIQASNNEGFALDGGSGNVKETALNLLKECSSGMAFERES